KGEKNPGEGSEKEPETVYVQAVGAPSLKCLALSDCKNHSKTASRLPTKWIDFFKPSRSVHRSTRATEVKKSSQFGSKSKRDI
ncbi:hypothetical protein KC821_18505, partial [Proteus vulgaris]|uniref:hypothetical protein n=1 Tax=Proteus vulgaris TaxID=585 RepID=UPI003315444C